ncbi:MAG: hypothetical protein AAF296_11610 [Pseudomonadota bacterium]
MSRTELAITLNDMLAALDGSISLGELVTTEAEIEAALEISFGYRDGELTAFGAPPSSRFETGIQNPVHKMQLRAAMTQLEGEDW